METFHGQVHSRLKSHIIIISLGNEDRVSTKSSHVLKMRNRNDYELIVSIIFQSRFIKTLQMLHLAFTFAED